MMQHSFIPPDCTGWLTPAEVAEYIDSNPQDFIPVARLGDPDTEHPSEVTTIEYDEFGLHVETCLSEDLGLSAARAYRANGELIAPIQAFVRNTPDVSNRLVAKSGQLPLILTMAKKTILAAHILYEPAKKTEDPYKRASLLFVARCLTQTGCMEGPQIGSDEGLDLLELIEQYKSGDKTGTYLQASHSAAGRVLMAANMFTDQLRLKKHAMDPNGIVLEHLSADDLRVFESPSSL